MTKSIPVKKLIVTTVLTAVIFTVLLWFLLTVNGSIPNAFRILIDTMISIIFVGLMHILILRYMRKRFPQLSAYKTAMVRYSITFLLTLFYTFAMELIMGMFVDPSKLAHLKTRQGLLEQLIGASLITILILLSHNQVLLRQQRIETELELSNTRAANVEAINLVLQQQIQPHFLFNALNVLNSLYKRDYNAGHTYMLHLASFLRASIGSTRQNLLTIAEEIKISNDYVAMQKLRFTSALNFNIGVDSESLSKGYLPSFSIQPLIENAIKHNELTNENPLQIDVYSDGGYLYVKNNISPVKVPPVSTGQGLLNLIKRYELLSGDEVQITSDSINFTVRIKILTSEYYHNRR